MRILYYSSTPECTSGYGNVTREVVKRLKAAGHYVRVATKHWTLAYRTMPDGTEIFEGSDIGLVNQMMEEEKFDYVFSYFDIWTIDGKVKFTKDKWAALIPVDSELIQLAVASVAKDAGLVMACSRHGERELRKAGTDPRYVPLGIDTARFRVKPEGRAAWRKEMGFTDENFVIGSVGLNYGDDRKGFIQLMKAFKSFHEDHPEARLYLHTLANHRGQAAGQLPYWNIAEAIGIGPWVTWANQSAIQIGRIDEEWLVDTYNGMDVMCLPSRGEGFGLPIIEAQACSVPVITTDTTTGPELVGGGGWLIPVTCDDLTWVVGGGWRHEVRAEAIRKVIDEAFWEWNLHRPAWEEVKASARVLADGYDWNLIWPSYWQKAIDEMERRLSERNKSEST
jgi:glycosyltransferase involved in cell wall biosynthesis